MTVRPAWKLNEFEKWMIAKRYARGDKVVEIAAAFDIAAWLISHHAQMRGIPPRRRPRKDKGTHRA
jgi:hypothetical protein